jgi:tryptophanyl-tRNA synthetase
MREFGISPFDQALLPDGPAPPRLFRENIVFGQRGFGPVLERMRSGGTFAIMSGLMPSGRMHLGHKMVIDQIMYFQRFGAPVFVGIADIESYATRNMPYEKAREIAIDSYVRNYLALGLGNERLEIYFQSKRAMVKDLAIRLGRRVNLSTMKSIYGFNDQTNLAHMHAPLVQAADILHPQLRLGPCPVVVPVGIDQDPHMRLTRDLASAFRLYNVMMTSDKGVGVFVKTDEDVPSLLAEARRRLERMGFLDMELIESYKALYVRGASADDIDRIDAELALIEGARGEPGFLAPASTYHRFIRGVTGGKMSSSKPETAIFLDDDPAEAKRKMMRAITGGKESAEEQRRTGGDPDVCSVYETMLFHTVGDEKELRRIRSECRKGERLCGGCKKEAAEHIASFLLHLKERRDETEHLIPVYVMED